MSTFTSSKPRVVAAALGLVAVIAAVGWFLLISPKNNKADELDVSIARVEQDIATRRAQLARPAAAIRVRASDLFRLSKAMPEAADVTGVLLEINRVARGRGITFKSIQPASPLQSGGYGVLPFQVVLEGRFGNVSGFLGDLRKLVRIKKERLDARGRLFSVETLSLGEPDGKKEFPTVKATVTIDAFLYSGQAPSTGTPGTASDDVSTPIQSTSPSPGGSVAAGATP